MGTTLTTLSFRGAERSAIISALEPTDQLRDDNAPWLTVVPSYGTDGDDLVRFEKTAKRLTKQSDAVALLFYYFDDDAFFCSLYQGGKKAASCESGGSWAKLGKKLGELFGSDAPSKAFRYSSHCSSLSEQLDLLEETVGAALFDNQEDEPRTVKTGDETLRRIKEREAALKRRPNRFAFEELSFEDYPDELKYRQKLYDLIRPKWRRYELSSFVAETDMSEYMIPGGDGLISYPYCTVGLTIPVINKKTDEYRLIGRQKNKYYVLIMNGKTGEYREFGPFEAISCRAIYRTRKGGTVFLIVRQAAPQERKDNCANQISEAFCLDERGAEIWRFAPGVDPDTHMSFVHASEDGVITLFAPGIDAGVKADATVFQIDGETGKPLRTLRFPYKDDASGMVYAEATNGFLLFLRSARKLILLDGSLNEQRIIEDVDTPPGRICLCGSIIWEGDYLYQRYVAIYDFLSGESRKISLEIPAYPISLLPDGRILGVNEKGDFLTVFDKDGAVAARRKFTGTVLSLPAKNGNVLIAEVCVPKDNGPMVYDALFDEISIHVWRLNPIL